MLAELKVWTAAALLAPLAAFAEEVDGIVARVDSEAILRSEVARELARHGAGGVDFKTMLDEVIDRKLILKAAQEAKMTMQDWVVENRVREIIERAFGGDRNKLMATLQAQKLTYPEWHAQMKDDMIVSAMRWQMVEKNVTASPGLMREEYLGHPERYSTGRRWTVEVILLKPEDADKRGEIDAALRKGSTFGSLARRYSADGKAAEGGLWRNVEPEKTFKPEVVAEIDRAKDGEITPWIDLGGWSLLARRVGSSASGGKTFADAYEEVAERVRAAEAERLYRAWIGRLRKNAFIRIYSSGEPEKKTDGKTTATKPTADSKMERK